MVNVKLIYVYRNDTSVYNNETYISNEIILLKEQINLKNIKILKMEQIINDSEQN